MGSLANNTREEIMHQIELAGYTHKRGLDENKFGETYRVYMYNYQRERERRLEDESSIV
jgi:hypothetical protein